LPPSLDPYALESIDLWTPPGAPPVAESCLSSQSIPAGQGQSCSVLGGSGVFGGVDATFDDTLGGTFAGNYSAVPIDEVQQETGLDPNSFSFELPGGLVQVWQMNFSGSFSGLATLVFGYADVSFPLAPLATASLLTTPQLAIYQDIDGNWVDLAGTVDETAMTITVTTDSVSTFVLPEPSAFTALGSGIAMLAFLRQRQRRGSRQSYL
jgi:hypothetical protein